MIMFPGKDSIPELTPILVGGEGTGFILWGDAGIDELIMHFFPAVTEDMKKDTTQSFSAIAAFEIDYSGAIIKKPKIIKKSLVPQWDTTVINTLHGWVFKSSNTPRYDTVEFRYLASKPRDDTASLIQAPGREVFNPAAFTTVDEILGEQGQVTAPADSITPLEVNFTFLGDVGSNDLEKYILPDLEGRMREKGVTYTNAHFLIVVNDNGLIDDVTVIRSTGKTAWDAEIERAMLQWRFKSSIRPMREAEVIFVVTLAEETE